MAYIEKKVIKGKTYFYLTETKRLAGGFKKTRKYLGTAIPKDLEHLPARQPRIAKKLTVKEAGLIETIKKNHASRHPAGKSLWRTERDVFVDFIYNTNAIEGNTLTREETDEVLKSGKIPKRKERDAREAENMKECIDFLFDYKGDISEEMVLKLHALQHKETMGDAGRYRNVDVKVGSYLCPGWQDIPVLMKRFLGWYDTAKGILHPFELASLVHLKIVKIHPFRDGNGRIARLLMNLILLRHGYPLLNIFNDEKLLYYMVLQKYDYDQKERGFVRYLFEVFVGQYRNYV